MNLQEKNKKIAELKELYRFKNNPVANKFTEKYPNAFAPFNNYILDYGIHIYFTILIFDNLLYVIKVIIGKEKFFEIFKGIKSIIFQLF